MGYTARCPKGKLFGSPALEGGQAQFVRVPTAGGTLFNLSDPSTWSSNLPKEIKHQALSNLSDSSLLLLADILPTGLFAATQAINHPKVQPVVTGRPWPLCFAGSVVGNEVVLTEEDRILTLAIVGLGPVGVCATVSMLDAVATKRIPYRIVAVDPVDSRREKMKAVFDSIGEDGKGNGEFIVLPIDKAKEQVKAWTNGIGCTAVLEVSNNRPRGLKTTLMDSQVVGNSSALTLAFELVRAFGAIVSVGVHGEPQIPFTGREFYNKNVSLDFGRCPARAMFPPAFDLLGKDSSLKLNVRDSNGPPVKRQDVFGGVGQPNSLIDRIVGFDDASESYQAFDKGEIGKVIFDPWK